MRSHGIICIHFVARIGLYIMLLPGLVMCSIACADEIYSARIAECSIEQGYAALRTEVIANDYQVFQQLLESRSDIVDESDGLTHSWRCDLAPGRSVTVKYRFDASHGGMCGAALRGTLSLWENGTKVLGPVSFGEGCGSPDVQSVRIDQIGLTVCTAGMGSDASCVTTGRENFSTTPDPNFTPGRVFGEPIVAASPRPMRLLSGAGDRFCESLAARFSADPNDPLADISAEPAWTVIPSESEYDHSLSYAVIDIDNDDQPDTVLKWTYDSHMSGGDRLYAVPKNSAASAGAVSQETFLREVWRRSGKTKELRELVPDPMIRRLGIVSSHFNLQLIRDGGEMAILVREQYEQYAGLSEADKDRVTRAVLVDRSTGEIDARCQFGPEIQRGQQL